MNLSIAPCAVVLAIALVVSGCGAGVAEPTSAVSEHTKAPRQITPRAPADYLPPPPKSEAGTTSPFDLDDPAIANLDPDLLEAIQAAAKDASTDGVRFWVTSGWRSRAKQQSLLDEAVQRYGSLKEALRYVSTPDKSAHVTGHAVDIGPTEADSWLAQHGSEYGLCQSFANEIWHFELGTEPGGTCPAPIPDSTYR